MITSVVVGSLLALGVAVTALATIGLVVLPSGMDRLHLSGITSSVAPVLIAVAVVADGLPAAATVELIVVVAVVFVGAPLTSHSLSRAFHIRQRQGWDISSDVAAASEVSEDGGGA